MTPTGDNEKLEAPAYLGRPFPGTSTGRLPLIARGLVGVSLLGFVAFASSAIYFRRGDALPGIVLLAVGLGCAVGAIVGVRNAVRRIVRTEGAAGPKHWYR